MHDLVLACFRVKEETTGTKCRAPVSLPTNVEEQRHAPQKKLSTVSSLAKKTKPGCRVLTGAAVHAADDARRYSRDAWMPHGVSCWAGARETTNPAAVPAAYRAGVPSQRQTRSYPCYNLYGRCSSQSQPSNHPGKLVGVRINLFPGRRFVRFGRSQRLGPTTPSSLPHRPRSSTVHSEGVRANIEGWCSSRSQ